MTKAGAKVQLFSGLIKFFGVFCELLSDWKSAIDVVR